MIHVWQLDRRPNDWNQHPRQDPRFRGLLDLAHLMLGVFDYAAGELDSGEELLPMPSELVSLLRDAAERIELYTDYERYV